MKESFWQKIKRKLHGTIFSPHIWRKIDCTVLCEHSIATSSHPRKFCTCGETSYEKFNQNV